MKITYGDSTIFINDNSDKAKKIAAGHDFHLDEKGRLVIDGMGTDLKNKFQIKKALKDATTLTELKNIILKLTDLI